MKFQDGEVSWLSYIESSSVGGFVSWSRHVLGRTPVVTNKKKIFVSKKLQYSKMFVILGEH